jgi:hypothetical protein
MNPPAHNAWALKRPRLQPCKGFCTETNLFCKNQVFLRALFPSGYFVSACRAVLLRGIVLKTASAE